MEIKTEIQTPEHRKDDVVKKSISETHIYLGCNNFILSCFITKRLRKVNNLEMITEGIQSGEIIITELYSNICSSCMELVKCGNTLIESKAALVCLNVISSCIHVLELASIGAKLLSIIISNLKCRALSETFIRISTGLCSVGQHMLVVGQTLYGFKNDVVSRTKPNMRLFGLETVKVGHELVNLKNVKNTSFIKDWKPYFLSVGTVLIRVGYNLGECLCSIGPFNDPLTDPLAELYFLCVSVRDCGYRVMTANTIFHYIESVSTGEKQLGLLIEHLITLEKCRRFQTDCYKQYSTVLRSVSELISMEFRTMREIAMTLRDKITNNNWGDGIILKINELGRSYVIIGNVFVKFGSYVGGFCYVSNNGWGGLLAAAGMEITRIGVSLNPV